MPIPSRRTALVLTGEIGLGAYEAGAYAALEEGRGPLPDWILGSSIGAATAAITVGNAPEHRIDRLRQFWQTAATDPTPAASFWFGVADAGTWRQAYNQASVLETPFLGRPGVFHTAPFAGFAGRGRRRVRPHDPAPLRAGH